MSFVILFETGSTDVIKFIKPLLLTLVILFSSCSAVKVAVDYDSKVDFKKYKTFAFYKTGIDKAEISDLDKKRILYLGPNFLTQCTQIMNIFPRFFLFPKDSVF